MAFATTTDVATRLGRSLTAAESAMAQQVIDIVTGLITTEVGEDTAWAAALDPVPALYRALCIEKVIGIGSNPNQLASSSEDLGHHSHSKRFRDETLFLSEEERDMVRLVIGTGVSGSVRVPSLVHDVYVTEDP